MKTLQPSFASGEITPLLHARVDLSRYSTALAELKNMIVLPQGGVTRRAGFRSIDRTSNNSECKLIPFVYNAEDSIILEFGDCQCYVFAKSQYQNVGYEYKATFSTPYAGSEVKDLRYIQSGNVIFLAHKNYPPKMLKRVSLTNWSLSNLNFESGPWINGENLFSGSKIISITNVDTTAPIVYAAVLGRAQRFQVTGNTNMFYSSMVGSLFKVDFTVEGETQTFNTALSTTSWTVSKEFAVRGNFNVTTTGNWVGRVRIERSVNGGLTWTIIKEYRRTDTEAQGQIDYTIAEQEEDVLFRVRATHETEGEPEENNTSESSSSSSNSNGVTSHIVGNNYIEARTTVNSNAENSSPIETKLIVSQSGKKIASIEVNITVSGYIKTQIYKITSVLNTQVAYVTPILRDYEILINNPKGILNWSLGAWGDYQGYPRAVSMFQDRLIFAGSKLEPQTIWCSRIGDYKNFAVGDPIADDDAITVTLSSRTADGIHSLLSSNDLLAFTGADEWKISGSGEGGILSPLAVSAHCYTTIGSKSIQPLLANGHVIFVQAQGKKVYALSYDLNIDGYSGSEISVLSSHLFEWKTSKSGATVDKSIVDFVYQRVPDSLLWFALSDGTAVTCTYNPEHETIGWAKHDSNYGRFKSFCVIPATEYSVLFSIMERENIYYLKYQAKRTEENHFTDSDSPFESALTTLRLNMNGENGSIFTSKKLISRLFVSVIRSVEAWIAPAFSATRANNWERRRRIKWNYSEFVSDVDIQIDSGFAPDAGIQIRTSDRDPLTIVAVSPLVTVGG